MLRAGRFFIFKLFKWFLGAVFVLSTPSEAIFEAPGGFRERFFINFGDPRTAKNLQKRCTVATFRGFRVFSLVFAKAAENLQTEAPGRPT